MNYICNSIMDGNPMKKINTSLIKPQPLPRIAVLRLGFFIGVNSFVI